MTPADLSRTVKNVYAGTESLGFHGPKIWKQIPVQLKSTKSLQAFKSVIKSKTQKSALEDSLRLIFIKWASFKISISSFYFSILLCLLLLLLFYRIADLDYPVVMAIFVVNYININMSVLVNYKCFHGIWIIFLTRSRSYI